MGLGLGVEKADYSTATGLGKGTAHANANGAYTAGDESHITGHTNWNTVKLTYNLKDTFDNAAAAQERTITITDTIAPTLYITQSSIRTAGYRGSHDANTCTGAECKCIHQEGGYSNDDNTGDFTTEHCVQNHHTDADGTTTATRVHNAHGNAIADAGTSAYGDELEIQHSAGYAQDYKYVQELMEEGNGYGCYDICSSTTTKVEWKKSCDPNEEAGSEFNMLKPGTYYLKYECNDLAANKATACRTFVNVDKTRPVITVLQAANTNHNLWTVEASATTTTLTLVPPAPTWSTATSPRMLRSPAMWSTWPLLVPTRSTTTAKTPPARPLSRPPVPSSSRTTPALPAPSPVAQKSSPSRLPSRTARNRPPAPTPSMVPCLTLTSTTPSTLKRPAPTCSPTPSPTRTATARTTPARLPPAPRLTTSPRPSLLRTP